ncbi:hypothetical protein MLD38_022702 [Melastoma candidum]|uniref:Uncharacterized protein n=1 Tax=Melastoma candidum TaxID=119954 RepID=A0ACB9QLZ3_9MYRT|nr:hypothetical protein MLD38_022702 [Melastoma candidum]
MQSLGVSTAKGGDFVALPNWAPGGPRLIGNSRKRSAVSLRGFLRGNCSPVSSSSHCLWVEGSSRRLGENCRSVVMGRCRCSGSVSAVDPDLAVKLEIGGGSNGNAVLDSDYVCIRTGTEDASIVGFNGDRDGVRDDFGEGFGGVSDGRVDVRALAASLRHTRTADDVELVLKDKGRLPLQVFSSMIRGFGKDKRIDAARAVVQWLEWKKGETDGAVSPNLFIYNSLLGAIKQSGNYDALDEVMSDMARQGISPNVVTYNTMMTIFIEQGRAQDSLLILDEIVEAGLVPTAVSYSTALLAYRRMEDGFGALRFFLELREKYLNGELGKDVGEEDWEVEFAKIENFMIRICYQVMRRWLISQDGSSRSVLKLLTDLDKAGLQLDRAEHERLIWACAREEHSTVARELYLRVRDKFSDISLSVCNHLIWLLGKAKRWWAALEIYEDLLDVGPAPNNLSTELVVSHFNVLLTAARRKGIWRWGIRLIDKMEDKGLKPGSREWNAVLVACSKASETGAAIEIFRRMVEKGEKPTIISYGALLSALEKGKLYDEAFRVWDHMLKVGVEPNIHVYTIMASIFAAQAKFNMVDTVIKDMTASGIEPTVVTYNAIISACGRISMGSAAYEWFHRMKVGNVSPNEVTYEMLIEALAKDGKPRIAYELYLRARNGGMVLCAKAYDAVVWSAQVHGATVDLGAMGPRPPERRPVQSTGDSNKMF